MLICPALAAGNNKTCLVFMGDWNTHKDRMRKDVSLAVTTARAHAVTPLVMTAPGTEQRDHAVCFCENRWWSAKVESIPAATYEALKDCYGKEHWPLFFSLTASLFRLQLSCLRLGTHQCHSSLLTQPRRVQGCLMK